jgi:hypothetical protein
MLFAGRALTVGEVCALSDLDNISVRIVDPRRGNHPAQNASAEDLFVLSSRSLDVGDGEKMRDTDPLSRSGFEMANGGQLPTRE